MTVLVKVTGTHVLAISGLVDSSTVGSQLPTGDPLVPLPTLILIDGEDTILPVTGSSTSSLTIQYPLPSLDPARLDPLPVTTLPVRGSVAVQL